MVHNNSQVPPFGPLTPKNIRAGFNQCMGCSESKNHCHNIVFGTFCIDNVKDYCRSAGQYADANGMRTVFHTAYNYAFKFEHQRRKKHFQGAT